MSSRVMPDLLATIRLPPREDGDRLTRDEFERRYRAMPARVKSEHARFVADLYSRRTS